MFMCSIKYIRQRFAEAVIAALCVVALCLVPANAQTATELQTFTKKVAVSDLVPGAETYGTKTQTRSSSR